MHAYEIRIGSARPWVSLELRELWEQRDLVLMLTRRELSVRYKQTIAGAFWAILQPFLAMLIFSYVFGRLVGIESDGIAYPLFSFAGLAPWMFFANNVINASNSIVGHGQIITKIYFPRLALPLAPVLSGLVDLALALVVLGGMLLYYGVVPSARVLTLPCFVLLAMVSSLGIGLILGALNVRYRDVGHAVPFLLQFGMFATPIIYPASLLTPGSRLIAGLNPMAGVAEGFRWAIFEGPPAPGAMIVSSALVSFALLVGGAYYFRRMEAEFADVV